MSLNYDEIIVKIAVNTVTEVFKFCAETAKGGFDWLNTKKNKFDLLGKAASSYTQHTISKYGTIKIYGMDRPVLIDGLYIHLNILHGIEARTIIDMSDLEERIDAFSMKEVSTYKERNISAVKAVKKEKKIVVLGGPGNGKTTLLKHIAMETLRGNIIGNMLPVFISLKEFSETNCSLEEYILAQFDVCDFPTKGGAEFIERLLINGKLIVLLDGLDEVDDKELDQVLTDVEKIESKYIKCRYVLTCRTAAYNSNLERFSEVQIAPFNENQIDQFVKKWFSGTDKKVGEKCLSTIRKQPSIREIAQTPLLLALLCLSYSETLSFTKNRAEIFEEGISALLKKWDSTRRIKRDDPYKLLTIKRKEQLLSRLAWLSFIERKIFFRRKFAEKIISNFIRNIPDYEGALPEIEGAAILNMIEAQHGIIVRRAKNVYTFSHLTFHEYFVAQYIENHKSSLKDLSDILKDSLFDIHWRDILILLSEMLTDAGEYLEFIQQLNTTILTNNVRQLLTIIHSKSVEDTTIKIPNYYKNAILLYMIIDSPISSSQGQSRSKTKNKLYHLLVSLRNISKDSAIPFAPLPGTKNILHQKLKETLKELSELVRTI